VVIGSHATTRRPITPSGASADPPARMTTDSPLPRAMPPPTMCAIVTPFKTSTASAPGSSSERTDRVGLGIGAAAILEDVGKRRPVIAASEGQPCNVPRAAPGGVAHRRRRQTPRLEPAADALRVRNAPLVKVALRGALVQPPGGRVPTPTTVRAWRISSTASGRISRNSASSTIATGTTEPAARAASAWRQVSESATKGSVRATTNSSHLKRKSAGGAPLGSVRSRSPSAGVLTVSAIKPTFSSATGAGPSDSYTRHS
jgi:hypothetical protein